MKSSKFITAPRRARRFCAGLRQSCLLGLLTLSLPGSVVAEDSRQLASLPPPAQEVLRQEMRDNLLAINEILAAVAVGKFHEAGDAAEQKLGLSAQGKHRSKPFEARPGPHMPPAMHALGMEGHRAASEFAKVAQRGDREATLALLPNLTTACVACHLSWRIR